MRDYFDELNSLIKKDSDVLQCRKILKEMANDVEWLRVNLVPFFERLTCNDLTVTSALSGNSQILGLANGKNIYENFISAISYHDGQTADSFVNHTIYTSLTPLNTDISVGRYLLPAGWDCNIFDKNITAKYDGEIELRRGEILEVRPDEVCYHFKFSRPTAILKVQSLIQRQRFEWSFDAHSGKPWQCISVSPTHSYLEHLCMASRALKDPRFCSALKELLLHDMHNIRWSAAQALGTISATEGVRALELLKHDSHPLISKTASSILESIKL